MQVSAQGIELFKSKQTRLTKTKAPEGFEPSISCLLDRRFNQLSHGATCAGLQMSFCISIEGFKIFSIEDFEKIFDRKFSFLGAIRIFTDDGEGAKVLTNHLIYQHKDIAGLRRRV